jgi:hypothetical protein
VAGEAELPGDDEREFGETVHRAIGAVLRESSLSAETVVRSSAQRAGLEHHLDEAAADVGRAMEALRREGLMRRPNGNPHADKDVYPDEHTDRHCRTNAYCCALRRRLQR